MVESKPIPVFGFAHYAVTMLSMPQDGQATTACSIPAGNATEKPALHAVQVNERGSFDAVAAGTG